MHKALKLAFKALPSDVPVGSLITDQEGNILAEAFNQREKENKLSAHAEILALDKACKKINNWRLDNCTLYITLEPCLMCTGAIIQSRLKSVYFGAYENKHGASIHIAKAGIQVIGGLLEDKCFEVLHNFFYEKRQLKQN